MNDKLTKTLLLNLIILIIQLALKRLNAITSNNKGIELEHLLRGDIFMGLKDHQNAINEYQKSFDKKYKQAESSLGIGIVKHIEGKYMKLKKL